MGSINISTFTAQRTSSGTTLDSEVYRFTFVTPDDNSLTVGDSVISIGLAAETFKSVSFTFKVNAMGAPYVAGSITPNQCYSQGGSTSTVLIANFPDTANTSALEVQFRVGGSVVSYANIVGAQSKESVFQGSIQKQLELSFVVPTSSDSTSHTETVVLYIAGELDVSTEFSYLALPQASFKDNSAPVPSNININGGTEMTIQVKNLGVTTSETLVAMFEGTYHATILSVSCGGDPSLCERGLVACIVTLRTPAMTALAHGDTASLAVYWSDRGASTAATTNEVTLYDPNAASVRGLIPSVGYTAENTLVQVQVSNLAIQGVYPTSASQVEAYFTKPGSTTQYTVKVESCNTDTSDGVTFNQIQLTMPPVVATEQVTVSLTIKLRQHDIAASTEFTYYLMPTTSPIFERVLPTTGPIDSPNDVQIKLSGFYKTHDITVEFVSTEVEGFSWAVQAESIQSTMSNTEFTVKSPVIWEDKAYDANGTPIVFSVLVYPTTLSNSKYVLGATFDWVYEQNMPWISAVYPNQGLMTGGSTVTLDMKMAHEVDINSVQEQVTVWFGSTAVSANTISASETLVNGERDVLTLTMTVPRSYYVSVVAIRAEFVEHLDLPDAQCNTECSSSGGYEFTTITGAASLDYGPYPSVFLTSAAITAITVAATNFLPVSDTNELTLSCTGFDGSLDSTTVITSYIGSPERSDFVLNLPQFSDAGTKSCTLQQDTSTPNPLTFSLDVQEPQIEVTDLELSPVCCGSWDTH